MSCKCSCSVAFLIALLNFSSCLLCNFPAFCLSQKMKTLNNVQQPVCSTVLINYTEICLQPLKSVYNYVFCRFHPKTLVNLICCAAVKHPQWDTGRRQKVIMLQRHFKCHTLAPLPCLFLQFVFVFLTRHVPSFFFPHLQQWFPLLHFKTGGDRGLVLWRSQEACFLPSHTRPVTVWLSAALHLYPTLPTSVSHHICLRVVRLTCWRGPLKAKFETPVVC